MAPRITRGDNDELTVPRELLEGESPEEGTLMRVHVNRRGDVILRPLARIPLREYTDEDLAMFAEEDRMPPNLEERLDALLKREPRLFRR